MRTKPFLQSPKSRLGPGHCTYCGGFRQAGAIGRAVPGSSSSFPCRNALLSGIFSWASFLLLLSSSSSSFEIPPKLPSRSILCVLQSYNCAFTHLSPRLDYKFFKLKEHLCLPRTKHAVVTPVHYLMWLDKMCRCGGNSMDLGLRESSKEVYLETGGLPWWSSG